MTQSKLQIKADVFKVIEPIRNASIVDDFTVEKALDKLREFDYKDFSFIAKLLIKEADCKNPKSASAFLYIAETLWPDHFTKYLLNQLKSDKIKDDQKIFFLNILSGLGITISPEDMNYYLKNPDEAINSETSKFLDSAKLDPEARIDFLDFYFASPETDKRELINSVVTDFTGDRLVNILSPLVLTVGDEETVSECLDTIEKSKSMLAIKPLKYLERVKNKNIAKKASKILRKMQMSGFYTEENYINYVKELLADFYEPTCTITTPDGNSNFSIVVSRKNKDRTYSILFSAINMSLGPFSCFGFSSITKKEHDLIIKRFFSGVERFPIPIGEGKRILSDHVYKRIEADKVIPYEYLCWERLVDDVTPSEKSPEDVIEENIKPHKIDTKLTDKLLKSVYVENWFFRYSKAVTQYTTFINAVMELNEDNKSELDKLLNEFAQDKEYRLKVASRIHFLTYILIRAEKNDLADDFYSLLYNEECFDYFIRTILQKSVYEHMLNLKLPKKIEGRGKVKAENEAKRAQELKIADMFIKYIESRWIKEN